jgi:hypothetical protein
MKSDSSSLHTATSNLTPQFSDQIRNRSTAIDLCLALSGSDDSCSTSTTVTTTIIRTPSSNKTTNQVLAARTAEVEVRQTAGQTVAVRQVVTQEVLAARIVAQEVHPEATVHQ